MKIIKTIIKTLIISILTLIIYNFLLNITEGQEYSDQEIVASVICAEACGEGKLGMYAVANVIANRSKKWMKTPYKIVTQKSQFFGYTSINRDILYHQNKQYCDYLSKNLLELKDITKGALYFKTIKERKRTWHKEKTITIKNHEFYK